MDNENSVLSLFSDTTKKLIAEVDHNQVSSLDDLLKMQEASDKSHKLHTALASWAAQQSEERRLRKLYAVCFAVILALQILFMNLIFSFIGFQLLAITEVQFKVFFISMFGEITALVLIVTKYLFGKDGNVKFIDIIKDL